MGIIKKGEFMKPRIFYYPRTVLLTVIVTLLSVFSAPARGVSDQGSSGLPDSELPDKVKLYYFYEELCELCNESGKYFTMLDEKLPNEDRNRYPHDFSTYNVYHVSGHSEYERITDSMGINRDTLTLPVLIAGGRVFQGFETIANNIREAYLTAGEDIFVNKRVYNPATKKTGDRLFDDYPVRPDHLNIVYFYRTTCPECAKVTPLIDQLSETVNVGGKNIPLDITRINTRSGNNGERISAFFESYEVPDADRVVPIVFFADSYLAGAERIGRELQGYMERNPGSLNRITLLLSSGK
jgi:thiol-disulfide isomerase/thioredoxin